MISRRELRSENSSKINWPFKLLGYGAFIVTTIMTPWFSLDPLVPVKLLTLSLVCSTLLAIFYKDIFSILTQFRRPEIFLPVFLFVALIVTFLFSGANKTKAFFGYPGRGNGFLFYFSLFVLLFTSIALSNFKVHFLKILLLTGGVLNIYGLLQISKLDPVQWSNKFSPVLGTFGNPNFQASFLAFSGIVAFSRIFESGIRVSTKVFLMLYLVTNLIVIYCTHSKQGFIVFSIGCAAVSSIFLYRFHSLRLFKAELFLAILMLVLVSLGSLNVGPLSKILFEESMQYRMDYWRSAFSMMLTHPFFGIGFSEYDIWYRRSRSIEAVVRRGPQVVADSAHNVPLEIGAVGGFPVFVLYLSLIAIVLISGIRLILKTPKFDPSVAGLFGVWIGYQSQTLISVNEISLAVWGWCISGLILGTSLRIIETQNSGTKSGFTRIDRRVLKKPSQVKANFKFRYVIPSVLLIGGISSPPFIQDHNFKTSVESGDLTRISLAALNWPQNSRNIEIASKFMAAQGEYSESLRILVEGVRIFPDDFNLWELIWLSSQSSPSQKTKARSEMKRLDPHNPDLK